jgi:hypothetical protein
MRIPKLDTRQIFFLKDDVIKLLRILIPAFASLNCSRYLKREPG